MLSYKLAVVLVLGVILVVCPSSAEKQRCTQCVRPGKFRDFPDCEVTSTTRGDQKETFSVTGPPPVDCPSTANVYLTEALRGGILPQFSVDADCSYYDSLPLTDQIDTVCHSFSYYNDSSHLQIFSGCTSREFKECIVCVQDEIELNGQLEDKQFLACCGSAKLLRAKTTATPPAFNTTTERISCGENEKNCSEEEKPEVGKSKNGVNGDTEGILRSLLSPFLIHLLIKFVTLVQQSFT